MHHPNVTDIFVGRSNDANIFGRAYCAQAPRIATSLDDLDHLEILEVVNVNLGLEDDDDSRRSVIRFWSLTCLSGV